MFIVHLPAGFLLARTISRFQLSKPIFTSILVGSIFPDLDMFWFYFIDGRQTHHHEYIPHWPLVYVAILLAGLVMHFGKFSLGLIVVGFGAGGVLHMLLDSIAAPSFWLAPFSMQPFGLVEVPATYSHWILNFVLHWTFLLELIICATAFIMMKKITKEGNKRSCFM